MKNLIMSLVVLFVTVFLMGRVSMVVGLIFYIGYQLKKENKLNLSRPKEKVKKIASMVASL